MARGVNKVIIVGLLGKDPEVRHMPNGGAVTSLSVATSEQWKDKQTGEKREATEWHNVSIFGKLAEIAAEYLRKGSQVYLEGKLKTDQYEKDGVTKYSTKIIANQMQMLGGGNGQNNNQNPPNNGINGQYNAQKPQQTSDSFDDDIPF